MMRLARRQGESLVTRLREFSELAVAGVGAPGRYVETMPTVLPWSQALSYIQPSKVLLVPTFSQLLLTPLMNEHTSITLLSMLTGLRLQVTTLDNGFRVISQSIPHCGVAQVGVYIDAGSRYETDANNGVAHFLEHLMFKGTKVWPLQLQRSIQETYLRQINTPE
jgi:Insulinase (Peptidase family M16)